MENENIGETEPVNVGTETETAIPLYEAMDLLKDMGCQIAELCDSLEKVKGSLEQNDSMPLWKKQGFDSMFLSLKRFSVKMCDVESWTKTAMIKAKED